MLTFHADRFMCCTNRIAQIELLCRQDRRLVYAISSETTATESLLDELCEQLKELESVYSLASATRLRIAFKARTSDLGERVRDLSLRLKDELEQSVFGKIEATRAELYMQPFKGWEPVIDRFKCSFDIEEAGKSLALNRPTASVFHLMRIVERGVLELQAFMEKPDPKAHFGSVLSKLDVLHRKTEFRDLPEHLKPYREFLVGVLAQLHAVKDSWRNKVSHVDGKIVPMDVFSEEMASGVYSATLLLMKKLAEGLPLGASA